VCYDCCCFIRVHVVGPAAKQVKPQVCESLIETYNVKAVLAIDKSSYINPPTLISMKKHGYCMGYDKGAYEYGDSGESTIPTPVPTPTLLE